MRSARKVVRGIQKFRNSKGGRKLEDQLMGRAGMSEEDQKIVRATRKFSGGKKKRRRSSKKRRRSSKKRRRSSKKRRSSKRRSSRRRRRSSKRRRS